MLLSKNSKKVGNRKTQFSMTVFIKFFAKNAKFVDLWTVVKFLLLLSHGRSHVERGFSVNNHVTTDNFSEETLIAHILIINTIIGQGGPECAPITKGAC